MANNSFYTVFDRDSWARLSDSDPLPLTEEDIARLAGTGDPLDIAEANTIYRPISTLLQLYVGAQASLAGYRSRFLGGPFNTVTPFVIGIAGSVAVGKSSTARLLAELLRRWPQTPRVELITTDGFLYPNAELERRGILHRKGFPESYNRRALIRFLAEVKSGAKRVTAPRYSHITYDIVPGEQQVVERPDILIVEGVNVLQPAGTYGRGATMAVSDFFDFSIYVDARPADIERWYLDRFLKLKNTAFLQPDSYFRRYADVPDDVALDIARQTWASVNLENLHANIYPTRGRATLIITKEADHRVHQIQLRKL
ncbi:MAG: type I pantothenate kinase [Varibaculum sp.]|nr:type I pantothenate kinase [Varibaculum sp.]